MHGGCVRNKKNKTLQNKTRYFKGILKLKI